MIKKTNLFIVGAAKSGTSTLWKCLKAHPEIYMPGDELFKEPGYFSNLVNHGLTEETYHRIFSSAPGSVKYVGEASTAYLTDPVCAKNIYDYNKNAKIVIILRNPVERAYSLYNWMVQEGYEYACTFGKALKLEKKRKSKKIPNFWEPEYYWNYMYYSSGLYSTQVMRYMELFSKNVYITTFDEFINHFDKVMREIYKFLHVTDIKTGSMMANESRAVVHPLIQFMLRKINKQIKNKIGIPAYNKNKERRDKIIYLFQSKKKPPGLDDSIRRKLIELYTPEIQNLEKLLNIKLDAWYKN